MPDGSPLIAPPAETGASSLSSPWCLTHRADPIARAVADRHYNRQKVGTPQFVPPGRCVVLRTIDADAFWVTSWPFAEYVRHAWAGAWICSAFRNEGARKRVAATRAVFGEPPDLGMVTFVDPTKVRTRGPLGWCYRKAGFREVGRTKGGLVALQMVPEHMPPPSPVLPVIPEQQTRLEVLSHA